jgi:outer membrane lipoprotein SlyB
MGGIAGAAAGGYGGHALGGKAGHGVAGTVIGALAGAQRPRRGRRQMGRAQGEEERRGRP